MWLALHLLRLPTPTAQPGVLYAANSEKQFRVKECATVLDLARSIIQAQCGLNRKRPHLLNRPVPPHVLRAEVSHLLVQVLQQHVPPRVHLLLQHRQLQLALPVLAPPEVRLELVHAPVDLPVLAEELAVSLLLLPPRLPPAAAAAAASVVVVVMLGGAELGHLPRQEGVQVRLLDGVVGGQVAGEVEAVVEELLEREVLGAAACGAGLVEEVEDFAEVFVLYFFLFFYFQKRKK